MLWFTLPEEERVPLTQRALAKELGVTEVSVSRWTKLPGFMDEVRQLITDSLGDVYHDVMGALKKRAKTGNFQHLKMYMEMMGVYTPKSILELDVTERAKRWAEGSGFTPEQVVARAEQIIAGED